MAVRHASFHRLVVLILVGLMAAGAAACDSGTRPVVENRPDIATDVTPDALPVLIFEDFEAGELDFSRWEPTSKGDFTERVVRVRQLELSGGPDYWLGLGAGTTGTSDNQKYLGVVHLTPFDFSHGVEIAFDLYWNDQMNGSYLTAALYVSPVKAANPRDTGDWLRFEYAGVPPGRNLRTDVRARSGGVTRKLYEDWGLYDVTGTPLGQPIGQVSHRIRILLDVAQVQVFEDGRELLAASPHNLDFTTGYLYLQMSSGTNYPLRQIFFDDVVVRGFGP